MPLDQHTENQPRRKRPQPEVAVNKKKFHGNVGTRRAIETRSGIFVSKVARDLGICPTAAAREIGKVLIDRGAA